MGWKDNYFTRGTNGELKDIFLFMAFVVMTKVRSVDLPRIYRSFVALAVVLVSTGFVSVFFEYRLAWLFNSLFRDMTTWGKQHLAATVFGFPLFLPIGLMNTHLTFGGLLLFVVPWIFFRTMLTFYNREANQKKTLWTVFLGIAFFVFLLNNARSALAGTAIAILFGLFLWREKGLVIRIPVWIPTTLVLLSLGTSLVLWNSSESFRTLVGPLLGTEKHTDSGRTFIWDSTLPLVRDNPILGVGSGNYPREIERSRKLRSLEYPELAFFYEVTQRGHAHNDYFHLTAVLGIPGLLLFLALIYYILQEILGSRLPFPEIAMAVGLVGFFFAALLQCYFQDDEVVIVFWYLLGFLYQSNRWKDQETI